MHCVNELGIALHVSFATWALLLYSIVCLSVWTYVRASVSALWTAASANASASVSAKRLAPVRGVFWCCLLSCCVCVACCLFFMNAMSCACNCKRSPILLPVIRQLIPVYPSNRYSNRNSVQRSSAIQYTTECRPPGLTPQQYLFVGFTRTQTNAC